MKKLLMFVPFILLSCGSVDEPTWWTHFWAWFYGDYVFHALVVLAIFTLVFFPGKLGRLLGRIKRVKAGVGGVEFEAVDSDIDPNTPCPYVKSRDDAFSAMREVNVKVSLLEEKISALNDAIQKVLNKVNDMSIDQQKQIFYDTDQPTEDRLAGGLRYVYFGGNHQTKPKVIQFARDHFELYCLIIKLVPELKLAEL